MLVVTERGRLSPVYPVYNGAYNMIKSWIQEPPMTMDTTPIKVFYSYAREDEALRKTLEAHLSLLKHRGVVQEWHDRRITAGQEWGKAIDQNLESADLILLLVSADFLKSDYCHEVELRRAMERHEAGEARVIPVILRAVDWTDALFGKLQCLPTDARPVTSWLNQDEAFADIARGIRKAVEEMQAAPGPRLTAARGTGSSHPYATEAISPNDTPPARHDHSLEGKETGADAEDRAPESIGRPVFIPLLPAGAHWLAVGLVTVALASLWTFIWIYTGQSDWLLLSGLLTLFVGVALTHALPRHFESMLRQLVNSDILHASSDEVRQICTDMEHDITRHWAYRSGYGIALLIVLAFLAAFPGPQILSHLPLILSEAVGGYFVGCYLARLSRYGTIGHQLQKRNLTWKVSPGHADEAGGLKPVGDFCLHQGSVVAMPALFLGTWLILFSLPDFSCKYGFWRMPYIILLVVAISFEVFAFFSPMLFFHRGMWERKRTYQEEVAAPLSKKITELDAMFRNEDSYAESHRLKTRLANALAYYKAIQRLPTWPIAPRTMFFCLFVLVISTLPLIAGVVGLMAQPPAACAVSYDRIGDVLVAQGNLPEALDNET